MTRWWVSADDGEEPDYRFTLANERTFLAWVRTALGLLAGGGFGEVYRAVHGADGSAMLCCQVGDGW